MQSPIFGENLVTAYQAQVGFIRGGKLHPNGCIPIHAAQICVIAEIHGGKSVLQNFCLNRFPFCSGYTADDLGLTCFQRAQVDE